MNPKVERIAYAFLSLLILVAGGLFVWNVTAVTADSAVTTETLELASFGQPKSSLDGPDDVPDSLRPFVVRNVFDPIITPPPTPTSVPTLTPTPTVPPCAVGFSLESVSRRAAKIVPGKGQRGRYVRIGDTIGDTNVVLEAITYDEKKVTVRCTDTDVTKDLVLLRER